MNDVSPNMLDQLRKTLKANSNARYAEAAKWFFKTGPGGYGEGDQFIGIRVPVIRKIAGQFSGISYEDIKQMLDSPLHEERLTAVLILVSKFKKGDEPEKKKVFKFYLKNRKGINNWDLIDLSAPNIVGAYLLDKEKKLLFKMASSENIWDRRISVLSTFTFIRNNEFGTGLRIIELLLGDKHDLIHKAAGWMLREIGKHDLNEEEKFLRKYYRKMPRTMLRYAIEKFPERKRRAYLKGKI